MKEMEIAPGWYVPYDEGKLAMVVEHGVRQPWRKPFYQQKPGKLAKSAGNMELFLRQREDKIARAVARQARARLFKEMRVVPIKYPRSVYDSDCPSGH